MFLKTSIQANTTVTTTLFVLALTVTPVVAQSGHTLRTLKSPSPALAKLQTVARAPASSEPPPLASDAPYVCTLSGFGHLAQCYPR